MTIEFVLRISRSILSTKPSSRTFFLCNCLLYLETTNKLLTFLGWYWPARGIFSFPLFHQLHLAASQREGERVQAVKSGSQAVSLVKYLEQREVTLLNSLQESRRQHGNHIIVLFLFRCCFFKPLPLLKPLFSLISFVLTLLLFSFLLSALIAQVVIT